MCCSGRCNQMRAQRASKYARLQQAPLRRTAPGLDGPYGWQIGITERPDRLDRQPNQCLGPEARTNSTSTVDSSLAQEFEPSEQTIRNWIFQAEADRGERPDVLTTDEREELSRLRRENRQLKVEREILRKAAAWFARESGTIPPDSRVSSARRRSSGAASKRATTSRLSVTVREQACRARARSPSVRCPISCSARCFSGTYASPYHDACGRRP
jgi:transposase